jgi:hypothetical protein
MDPSTAGVFARYFYPAGNNAITGKKPVHLRDLSNKTFK